MDRIGVGCAALLAGAAQLGAMAREVASIEKSIRDICAALPPAATRGVKSGLLLTARGTTACSADMTALQTGLLRAEASYSALERRLGGTAWDGAGSAALLAGICLSANPWVDKARAWIKRLLTFMKKKQPPQTDVPVNDNAASAAISALFAQEAFSKETWKRSSLDERLAICEKLIEKMNGILGTSVSTEIKSFYDDSKDDGLITLGSLSYVRSGNDSSMYVSMNTLTVSTGQYQEVMDTMVHEMRHGYQHTVVDNPQRFAVDSQTVEAWRQNFAHYKSSSRYGFDAYRAQPVEQDARSFAASVSYR